MDDTHCSLGRFRLVETADVNASTFSDETCIQSLALSFFCFAAHPSKTDGCPKCNFCDPGIFLGLISLFANHFLSEKNEFIQY